MFEKEHINPAAPPLHLACGNDELRPIFANVVCRNGHLAATDAHVLVHVPADHVFGEELAEALEGKLIPGSAFKVICEAQRKQTLYDILYKAEGDHGKLEVHTRQKLCDTKHQFALQTEGQDGFVYPIWESIWNSLVAKEPESSKYALNIDKLKCISKILVHGQETKNVVIDFRHHNSGVLMGTENGQVFGLLMPTMVSQPEQRITQTFKTKQS